jgi:hypothetical protein
MENLSRDVWGMILLACDSDKEYVNACFALVPSGWREYFLRGPAACLKRRRRFTVSRVLADGTQEWRYKGQFHREGDLPARVFRDGKPRMVACGGRLDETTGWSMRFQQDLTSPARLVQEWWRGGKRHREGDRPAVVHEHGYEEWWIDGQRHREGHNPAVVDPDHIEPNQYWRNGQRFRKADLPQYDEPPKQKPKLELRVSLKLFSKPRN